MSPSSTSPSSEASGSGSAKCRTGTYSDMRDQRYWTELDIGTSDIGLKRAESDIISDIGINFYLISDIQKFINQHSG